MWTRQSHILTTLEKADSDPKVGEILLNNNMEVAFRDINHMVFTETLPNYTDWKVPFTLHTYDSDNQLGAVISQNDNPVASFLR